MGKVYLVGIPDEDRYKIGWTQGAIDKRIAPLQTGNPKKIEVIHLFETNHHVKVETWMHNIHGRKRMEGEWFELTQEDIVNFKADCQKGHDVFQMLIDSGNPFV
jgi:hypothetical protein